MEASGRIWPNFELILCMSSLPANMKRIQLKIAETTFDLYETLYPQQMLVHTGGQIKNWSGGVQRRHTYKIAVSNYSKSTSKSRSAKEDYSKKKNIYFFSFSPIDLLIILYLLTKSAKGDNSKTIK